MEYITNTLGNLVQQTAFLNLTWGNYIMIAVACFFLYLAIKHGFEPLLLVPIAFGMLLVNIYPDIMANPTYAKVLEGARLARENHAELILGVGGGSVMDCCKAISIAARYDGDVWANFWARPGISILNRFLWGSLLRSPEPAANVTAARSLRMRN